MKSRRWVLYTLALINFTNIVDSMIIMPLGDIFIDLFDLTASQFSLLVSAYAIAASFSSLIAIVYLDIFDRKKALLFLYFGFSLGTLLCSFATSYSMLLLLRVLTGLFGGVMGALILSILSDLYPFKERGTAMGTLMMAFSAASALGIPIGLYLAAKDSWELPFRVLGIAGLFITLFIYFYFPPFKDHLVYINKKRTFNNTIGVIFRDKNQRNALIAGFFLLMGHFLIIPFISPYMIKNVGLSQEEISYTFFFGGLATIFTSPIIGRLTDKYGVFKVFVIMMFISFIPTIVITNMANETLIYALSFTTLFFVSATGRMIPPQTLITATAPLETRGSFMSFKSSLQQLSIALAALISGAIMNINANNQFDNYEYVGYLSILFCLVTILLIFRLKVAKDN